MMTSDKEADDFVNHYHEGSRTQQHIRWGAFKIIGPEHTGCRPMDKLDLVLIPLLYLFWMTSTLISVAINLMPTSSKVSTAIRNAITWTTIISLHMILFVLSALHRLNQIPIIKIPLNMMEQSIIGRACLFWTKFYYCLFKPDNNRRTIWEIITSPVPPDGRKSSKQSNRIPCLNATFSCFSSYQV